ncbi:MAG TPA: sugar ABC transporter substrate-binding protein [Ruminiclostridium sp.]
MKKLLALLLVITTVGTLLTGCAGLGKSAQKASDTDTKTNTQNKNAEPTKNSNLEESLKVDISGLKSNDGQPLILPLEIKKIPQRPEDPLKLPETNPLHWFDAEYAGWNIVKINTPKSPANGAIGKRVVMIAAGEHPYWTAVGIGAKKIADAYDMDYTMLNANYDLNLQNQLIDKTINEKPDMIILAAIDAKASVQQARKINQAGIPLIMFNTIPDTEALKYALTFTGPDDWGQFRMLARIFADKLGKKGGVAYLTHMPGGSPYFSRLMAPITELSTYAPNIKTLDVQSPGFDAPKSKQVVSDWIMRFGNDINGIVCADDSSQIIGAIEACKNANRKDIVIVAAGNSKIGMNAIDSGDLYASTYQSAEADGATPVKMAADWFNAKEIPNIAYLTKHLITEDDVQKYMPAQW